MAIVAAMLSAMIHVFATRCGTGSDALCTSRSYSSPNHKPSSMSAIYERTCGSRHDFLYLEVDTTYRQTGKRGFRLETVCDRNMRLRSFDGAYADLRVDPARCFAKGSGAIVWHDTGRMRRIMDYECNHATAIFGGREWEIWYTDRLPYCAADARKSDPAEGLILEAGSTDGYYRLKIKHIMETIG